MPPSDPKVKRVVSTNLAAPKNPVTGAAGGHQPPFLVNQSGIVAADNKKSIAEAFCGDWDVLVLGDGGATGLPPLARLSDVTEVLWLLHGGSSAKSQREELVQLFGEKIVKIPFHHDDFGYRRYLDKLAALFAGGSEYAGGLEKLDQELRAEQTESDVCDFLWLWAGYRHSNECDRNFAALRAAFIERRDQLADRVRGIPDLASVGRESSDAVYRAFKECLRDVCRRGA